MDDHQTTPQNEDLNDGDASQDDPDYLAYLQTLAPIDNLVAPTHPETPDYSPRSNDFDHPIIISDDPSNDFCIQPHSDSDLKLLDQPLSFNLQPPTQDLALVVASPPAFVHNHMDPAIFSPVLSSLNVDCPALELAFGDFITTCLLVHGKSAEDTGEPTLFTPPSGPSKYKSFRLVFGTRHPRVPTALSEWLRGLKRHLANQIEFCGIYYKAVGNEDYLWRIYLDSDPKFGAMLQRHPPFYFSEDQDGSLAYTVDTVEPHKSGFICLHLKDESNMVLPSADVTLLSTQSAQSTKKRKSTMDSPTMDISAPNSPAKKRTMEAPPEDPPAPKRGKPTLESPSLILAKEAAINLLPQQP